MLKSLAQCHGRCHCRLLDCRLMSSFILFIILTTGSSHSKCVSEKSTEHWEKEKKEAKKKWKKLCRKQILPGAPFSGRTKNMFWGNFLGEPKTCFGESFWGTGGISGKLRRSIFFFFFFWTITFFFSQKVSQKNSKICNLKTDSYKSRWEKTKRKGQRCFIKHYVVKNAIEGETRQLTQEEEEEE